MRKLVLRQLSRLPFSAGLLDRQLHRQRLLLGASIKSTLGAFFPIFIDGNIGGSPSSLLRLEFGHSISDFAWRSAGRLSINAVVTVAKIVPFLCFILIMFLAFKFDMFKANFWGGEGMPTKNGCSNKSAPRCW